MHRAGSQGAAGKRVLPIVLFADVVRVRVPPGVPFLSTLPRPARVTPTLLVDVDERGKALGIEILGFDAATLAQINDVLVSLGHAALSPAELAPLHAA